eukprot:3298188-Rhodomonas_salina.4
MALPRVIPGSSCEHTPVNSRMICSSALCADTAQTASIGAEERTTLRIRFFTHASPVLSG